MKTTRARVAELERRLIELHSYELPEFLVIEVQGGNEQYLKWVTAGTAHTL
jgi:periplasmic divalent cation tolerance protein